ncbi:histidine phosphatase family protein [Parapedobacter sp. 10938]|uniref:histidine phosphatase family protein n=1 Tax=Parapedobacter flavus TaxID=3110225 RepID=UPI002DB5FA93|nr:histidine phosphatase family protein [Parapedobacter sp. 10938]MEC3878410.1 histidine phosphatase family protein [Parapedobacter sp. 10938]
MLHVYLLRHGETTYNADGNRYCGRTDAKLTENGLAQAQRVANALQGIKIDAVYASPLERAYRTAEIAVGSQLPVTRDARLIELDFGAWEGKTRAEFVAESPALWEAWNDDPTTAPAGGTGDTAAQVVQRVDDFFAEMQRRHDGQTIVVVAHNGVNRLYLAHKLGMPLRNYRRIVQENSAITLIRFGGDEPFALLKLND